MRADDYRKDILQMREQIIGDICALCRELPPDRNGVRWLSVARHHVMNGQTHIIQVSARSDGGVFMTMSDSSDLYTWDVECCCDNCIHNPLVLVKLLGAIEASIAEMPKGNEVANPPADERKPG